MIMQFIGDCREVCETMNLFKRLFSWKMDRYATISTLRLKLYNIFIAWLFCLVLYQAKLNKISTLKSFKICTNQL